LSYHRAMMRIAGVVAALCALAGCKKDDKADKPAAKPGSPTVAQGGPKDITPAADPWADAHSTKVATKTGMYLSKIDTSKDPAPLDKLAAKIKVDDIAKPAEQLAIRGLSSAKVTGFAVTYNPSTNPVHEQFRSALQSNHVFEQVAQGLNQTVRLPQSVDIELVDCNTINAFYDPNTKRIIVCYELLDYFLDVFKPAAKSDDELGNAVIGATMFSFYHETGHGLIHLLDLPAVGREEDSVDQLATLTLIAMGDEGVRMAESGAYWFQLQSKQGGHDTPFWDEHGFDGQRFYNIMCLIYGSNPQKYSQFVSTNTLPEERAKRCPEEYAKINKAWEKLLQPYLTNGAAVNVDYKPTVATTEAPKTTAKDPWGDSPSGDSTAHPTPSTPPPPPPAPTHAITCEDVATRAAQLIGKEAQDRARSMTPEQIEELKARLESQLPAAMQQILAECAKADWPDAARKCVIDAQSLAAAEKCK
jgi:putative metallopeptidase DUF4344